ncbi:hypothetical protein EG68_08576 [Paragonimus skrjabini miyazakii]|uniref:PIH1D1/2/3 CS-like domain-containing protein n=1 Tax=Paragonimus skrjabini miyazakii TaxID=59628 RepID=A0A8S9YND9_9TREM|nr:hypothetical protein EG68_08576 [Paragonimus skrjabini miyazakii]
MDQLFTHENITALQQLLKDPEEDVSDSDKDEARPSITRMKPGDIGPKVKRKSKSNEDNKKQRACDPNAIWDAEEVPEDNEFEDIYDPRPQPEYELIYKQAVTTEDIYLPLGMKNPTTASCEFLVAKIKLPGCKKEDIKLDVKEKFLDLRVSQYKLGLHLPNPVDPDSSRAEWIEEKHTLEVTMRNHREFDFMNE